MCRGHSHSRCSTAQAGLVRGAAGVSRKDGLAFVPPSTTLRARKLDAGTLGTSLYNTVTTRAEIRCLPPQHRGQGDRVQEAPGVQPGHGAGVFPKHGHSHILGTTSLRCGEGGRLSPWPLGG